jgi:hypothetical protein
MASDSGTLVTVDIQISEGLGPLIIDEAQVRYAIRNVIGKARRPPTADPGQR